MGKARKRIPVIPIVFGLLFLLIVVIAVVLVVGMNHGASVSNCWHFTQLSYGKPILANLLNVSDFGNEICGRL